MVADRREDIASEGGAAKLARRECWHLVWEEESSSSGDGMEEGGVGKQQQTLVAAARSFRRVVRVGDGSQVGGGIWKRNTPFITSDTISKHPKCILGPFTPAPNTLHPITTTVHGPRSCACRVRPFKKGLGARRIGREERLQPPRQRKNRGRGKRWWW